MYNNIYLPTGLNWYFTLHYMDGDCIRMNVDRSHLIFTPDTKSVYHLIHLVKE